MCSPSLILGTPQVPLFTSKPHSTQGTKYTITWKVNSHTPVDEYSLMYRKVSLYAPFILILMCIKI